MRGKLSKTGEIPKRIRPDQKKQSLSVLFGKTLLPTGLRFLPVGRIEQLASGGLQAQVSPGRGRRHTPPRRTQNQPGPQQIRFIDVFQSIRFFPQADRQSGQPDGPAFKTHAEHFKNLAVQIIETQLVYAEDLTALHCRFFCDDAPTPDLYKIPNPSEQTYGESWSAA